jgi:hypothetical protein
MGAGFECSSWHCLIDASPYQSLHSSTALVVTGVYQECESASASMEAMRFNSPTLEQRQVFRSSLPSATVPLKPVTNNRKPPKHGGPDSVRDLNLPENFFTANWQPDL